MQRRWVATCLVGWLGIAACGSTRGPLFVAADAQAGDAAEAGSGIPDAAADLAVRAGMRLQYQLAGARDTSAEADLFVIDLFETSSAEIERLHGLGRSVIAFVAAGSYEPWRPDVGALAEETIGQPLAGYPQEAWLDVRDPSVRQLMAARLTLAADKGFDGVLLVSLDAYLADSGHDLTAADQLDYSRWLAVQAAERGLLAGISSDWPHATQLAEHYAFAIHLNCLANQRCAELAPYRERGRPVFDLETSGDASALCAQGLAQKLAVTIKRESFDAWFQACP
jgi:hypothetical protein